MYLLFDKDLTLACAYIFYWLLDASGILKRSDCFEHIFLTYESLENTCRNKKLLSELNEIKTIKRFSIPSWFSSYFHLLSNMQMMITRVDVGPKGLTLMLLLANLANTKIGKKPGKVTETLAHG